MKVVQVHYYGCSPHETELTLTKEEWERLQKKTRITIYDEESGHKYTIRVKR